VNRPSYTKVPRATLWLLEGDDSGLGSFYLSKTPITLEHYLAFRPDHHPGEGLQDPEHPAVNVSHRDALDYCAWYSAISGKAFRLPTDAEWARACRGASTGEAFAWDLATSGGRLPRVEEKRANRAGLHDMVGTIREWTAEGSIRGSSFRSPRALLDPLRLEHAPPELRADDLGFRIARSLNEDPR
jgi:formylglycine-generating enzyme required for sulfatase activity